MPSRCGFAGRRCTPPPRSVSRSNFAPCGRRPDEQAISLSGGPDSSGPSDGASFLWAGDQELAERWSSHWITRPPSQTERHPCRSLRSLWCSLPQGPRHCASCCSCSLLLQPTCSVARCPARCPRQPNTVCVCQVISPCVSLSQRCGCCVWLGHQNQFTRPLAPTLSPALLPLAPNTHRHATPSATATTTAINPTITTTPTSTNTNNPSEYDFFL